MDGPPTTLAERLDMPHLYQYQQLSGVCFLANMGCLMLKQFLVNKNLRAVLS